MKKSIFDKLTGSTKIIPQETGDAYPAVETSGDSAPEAAEEDEEGQLALDVFQTENDIVIKSTVAGVAAENIDITVTGDMVTIRGERKQDEDVPPEHYYYQECYWGPFSRSVILPVDIDADRIDAAI